MTRVWLCALALFSPIALAQAEASPPEAALAASDAASPDPGAAPASPAAASPSAAPPAASLATAPPSAQAASADPPVSSSRAPVCADTAAVCVKNENFALWPRVRIRTGYEFLQADPQVLYVGQNDGFLVDQLRVGLDGAFRQRVRFRFILDATSVLPGAGQNQPVSSALAAARDVWLSYSPSEWLVVSAGQQFMPSDAEGTTTIAALPFARRSVATSGVRAGHGNAVTGLSPTRQIGLVVGTGGPWGGANPRLGPISLEYKLGLSNGNGQNFLGNDNKLPALYGRLGFGFEDLVSVGFGGRFNPRTVGAAPNLYAETDSLAFADLTVRVAGIEIVGQGIYRSTSLDTVFPDAKNDAGQETGMGGTGWIWLKQPFGLDLFGIQPAYRISYFDPSSAFATDQLLENSVGLRWDVPVDVLRMSFFADYTLLTEVGEGARDLQNDRFTALVQLEL